MSNGLVKILLRQSRKIRFRKGEPWRELTLLLTENKSQKRRVFVVLPSNILSTRFRIRALISVVTVIITSLLFQLIRLTFVIRRVGSRYCLHSLRWNSRWRRWMVAFVLARAPTYEGGYTLLARTDRSRSSGPRNICGRHMLSGRSLTK